MTWWRRDATVSPVHRYAQRLLRSHEAALRSRCFSRTPSESGQHEEDGNTKRPAGMSNLEWLQLQHYQRWRKRLMDDPYRAIFGASNDMLGGKGLKDWEWISKSFPKWMLREMESHNEPDKDKTTHPRHPKRVDIKYYASVSSQERDSHFPQPTFRATRLDRDDSSGIVSPSDMRRPREQSFVAPEPIQNEEDSSKSHQNLSTSQPTPPKSSESFSNYITKTRSDAATKLKHSNKADSTNERSFMNEFLTEMPQPKGPMLKDPTRTSTWRETALQRRSLPDVSAKPDEEPGMLTDSAGRPYSLTPSTQDVQQSTEIGTERHSPRSSMNLGVPAIPKSHEPAPAVMQDAGTQQEGAASTRSTSRILSQLPEDDIDLLSAADIRASMGTRKSKFIGDEQKKVERLQLEKNYVDVLNRHDCIEPIVESSVINDQQVRRLERQMQKPQQTQQPQQPSEAPQAARLEPASPEDEGVIETSIERMKSWLEQGGAVFSSIFWQDPTIEANAEKTRLYFDKVLERIRKGRTTMKQVIEDLENDIPASKPLLKRMKADEDLLDSAISALRQRAGSGKIPPLTPKKIRAIQAMRLRFQDTDSDLNKAYATLQEISNSDAAKNASPALKRRLTIADKIIQKNAHLTRYLIWSLQARLEDPEIDQSLLVNYKAVANSLLTLRDTQMALARLLERAMLVYGVSPRTMEDIDKMSQANRVEMPTEHGQSSLQHGSLGLSEVDKAQLRAKIAAEERLAHEVDAQKSAMCGLSDDGYARAPKSVARKSFDEGHPLVHSLFRPFGPVLESLETEKPVKLEATKGEDTLRNSSDDKLIGDVKSTYEDTDSLITVGHEQSAEAAAKVKLEQQSDVTQFHMLKDDPTNIPESSARLITPSAQEMADSQDAIAVEVVQEIPQDPLVETHATSTPETAHLVHQINEVSGNPDIEPPSQSTSSSPVADLPTHYTILIHDPQTGKLSLTTSTSDPPRDTSPVVPLHQALAMLDQPAKFVPYITDGLEIITAKKDMLILRDALNPVTSTKPFETINTSPAADNAKEKQNAMNINPIDGTTRLSPTGYVGPAESQEQLEKEFAERRMAAERLSSSEGIEQEQQQGKQKPKNSKKGGRGAGVVKTAIWAATACYVVGVIGEIAS
ncbi:conserved serine-threonine rich [Pyrenophora seminiperda CCB06]|uniref:Conserved serine-threonine rich n=1 Tax=Pyrenophora seminiperda CCB06 TaxID=1302712 RepID=A0A3M7MG17_9PLEO|nr:conserved serine-threonine rich [Pyrenophora seminiperda CCB06]